MKTIYERGTSYRRGHSVELPAKTATLDELRKRFEVVDVHEKHVVASTVADRDGFVDVCEFWYPKEDAAA